MQAILISLIGGAISFVLIAAGAGLLVSTYRRRAVSGDPESAARSNQSRVFAGIGVVVAGIVVFLASFGLAFFGSLPGPGYLEVRRQVGDYLKAQDPNITIRGVGLSWSFKEPVGEGCYDVRVKTGSGERHLKVWFDPVSKKTTRIEEKRPNQALQTTPMTRSVCEKTIEFGRPQRGV